MGWTLSDSWPVPVATALISVAGALVTIVFSRRAAKSDRHLAADQLATRFTEPLLQASFNLETRKASAGALATIKE